ncbi:MAG: glycosyltransferase family 39 protein [Desulfuromonadales bacterium]|nr:glycosyltransferase family 39 protein [Desulfuromonadales bacterium]
MTLVQKFVSREFSQQGVLCELLILGVVFFLFLTNLGNGYLWQDEAQTALIARTILHGGLPLGYDGVNFFSQELGADYGANYLWKWHPWFPFYLLALFFSVHISTFTARLPFALFGVATVVLGYIYVRTTWKNRRLALLASFILATCVPFLILSRQCKYLSITAFFSLLALYGYSRITADRKHGATITTIALIFLFNTHYIYCVPLGLTMMIHALIYHRRCIKIIVILYAIVGIVNIPGIIWYGGTFYSSGYQAIHTGTQAFMSAKHFIAEIFQHVVPVAILIPVIYLWISGCRAVERFIPLDKATKELVALLSLFIISCLAILSVTSPAPYFRYLSPLIPVLCILMAMVVEAALTRSLIFGALIVMLLLYSNPLKDYWYEMTHKYNGPIEGIVSYLNNHAKTSDIVAITYEDLPLKFYTTLQIVGGLTGENLLPARNADWIIIRKHVICDKDEQVRLYLEQNVDWHNYQAIPINSPDIPFENNESPSLHQYRTMQDEDPVIIFKKIR